MKKTVVGYLVVMIYVSVWAASVLLFCSFLFLKSKKNAQKYMITTLKYRILILVKLVTALN